MLNIVKLSFPVWILGVFLVSLGNFHYTYAIDSRESIDQQLQNVLLKSQESLGTMQLWQKTLFSEEVLPFSSRFVRDYRVSTDGVKAEVDIERLKKFLKFYAPDALKIQSPQILVLLKPDASCEKCNESLISLKQIVDGRLSKRGLIPIWLSSSEISADTQSFFEAKMKEISKTRNAVGELILEWSELPPDDSDTAHADEKHFLIRSSLRLSDKDIPSQQKEILDTEKFETIAVNQLTELFIELGARWDELKAQAELGTREEILIEFKGVKNFAQYQFIRNALQSQLKDVSSLNDRKFSRGKVSFAIKTTKSTEEIKQQVSGIKLQTDSNEAVSFEVR